MTFSVVQSRYPQKIKDMKKYKVIAEHTMTYSIVVEARNEEDARNMVLLNEFDSNDATLVEEGERTIISIEAEKKPL